MCQKIERRAAGAGLLPAVLLGCLAIAAAVPASAEVRLGEGRVEVVGRLASGLVIARVEQRASGGARTELQVGTVERTTVRGKLVRQTTIGSLIQHAEGQGAVAGTAIGTISDTTTAGDLTNSVTVGHSINIAIGAFAHACTELGVFGPSEACR